MIANIFISSKLQIPDNDCFVQFLQALSNRRGQGHARYGAPRKEQNYLSRLKAEVKAYKKTGNCEHLYNIAVYCWLEKHSPENAKFHFDTTVDSVTRKKFGS